MDLKAILFDSSKVVAIKAAEFIGEDPEKFEILFNFVLENQPQYSSRAVRVFYIVGAKHPHLVKAYIGKILHHIPACNTGVERGFLKLLIDHVRDLAEEEFGILMDHCFHKLTDPKSEAATKIYSMKILFEMYRVEPIIGDELKHAIEGQMEFGSKAVKVIGEKILKTLSK